MDDPTTEFADWVAATARGFGYRTDAQLAAAIKVQQSTVTRWRQGSQPSIRHLVALARLFQMRIGPLLAMSGHVPPDLLSDAELPGPPVTESVRRILEAPVSDSQRAHLLEYWDRRLDEERTRLTRLISWISASEETSKRDAGERLTAALYSLTQSKVGLHVLTLIANVFTIEMSPATRRRRSPKREGPLELEA